MALTTLEDLRVAAPRCYIVQAAAATMATASTILGGKYAERFPATETHRPHTRVFSRAWRAER